MRKFALALVFMLSALCINAQDYEEYLSFGENADDQDTDFLGFCLLPGSNLLERFVEIHINPDGTLKYTYLTMDGFVNRAAGRERSAANSKGQARTRMEHQRFCSRFAIRGADGYPKKIRHF